MAEIFKFSTIEEKTSYRSWSTTKNVINDKMAGGVDIVWRIFEKIAKKLKLKSVTVPKKAQSFNVFR